MLTLKPMCFSQVAQGTLHTPLYPSPTHTKDGAAGEQQVDRWVGAQSPQPHGLWRQSHCPFPGGTGPQQSLDLSLELSKSPSHLAHSPHSLELWFSPAARALGSAVCHCPVAPDPKPVPFEALHVLIHT